MTTPITHPTTDEVAREMMLTVYDEQTVSLTFSAPDTDIFHGVLKQMFLDLATWNLTHSAKLREEKRELLRANETLQGSNGGLKDAVEVLNHSNELLQSQLSRCVELLGYYADEDKWPEQGFKGETPYHAPTSSHAKDLLSTLSTPQKNKE